MGGSQTATTHRVAAAHGGRSDTNAKQDQSTAHYLEAALRVLEREAVAQSCAAEAKAAAAAMMTGHRVSTTSLNEAAGRDHMRAWADYRAVQQRGVQQRGVQQSGGEGLEPQQISKEASWCFCPRREISAAEVQSLLSRLACATTTSGSVLWPPPGSQHRLKHPRPPLLPPTPIIQAPSETHIKPMITPMVKPKGGQPMTCPFSCSAHAPSNVPSRAQSTPCSGHGPRRAAPVTRALAAHPRPHRWAGSQLKPPRYLPSSVAAVGPGAATSPRQSPYAPSERPSFAPWPRFTRCVPPPSPPHSRGT